MIDQSVLFFGDSLIVGVGDPEGRGWVGRIVAASFDAGRDLVAYNLGVRGETSIDVLQRWRLETEPRLRPTTESRVIFSFGVNDTTLEDGQPRVGPTQSLEALAALLNQAASLKLPALVVGPAPVDDEEQNERISSVSRRFVGACREEGVPFIDVFRQLRDSELWRKEVAAGDGAHPGPAGYELLAELVLAAGWLEWLKQP